MKIPSLFLFILLFNCSKREKEQHEFYWDSAIVIASAYNSTVAQTSSRPQITAFGDSLKPGMNYIAVSRDLLRKGFAYNTPVVIEGFSEVFIVKDKMHRKWKNHIDIYMGNDIKAAREWGRRKVCVDFKMPSDKFKLKHKISTEDESMP